jgi:thiamine pyrophosphate-dependent acetolactate synthase large subunit-like protein
MHAKNGAAILIETLEELNCDHIFGIPGIHNLRIYDELIHSSIKHITARNEAGAGFMADGYARSTGKTGVALVITGPGLTNISTAMGEALHDSVPMVVISSQLSRRTKVRDSGFLHELKNSTILASSIAKESRCISSADRIAIQLKDAFALASTGKPGPVHVEIPLDVLEEVPGEDLLSSSEFKAACRLLEKAKSPLIIAGGGAAGAAEELKVLAEKLMAPVVTTLGGKGVLPEDHPLALGTRMHLPCIKRLMSNADIIIGVGTEFSPTDLWEVPLELNGKLIQVNISPADFDNEKRCDVGICGDAAEVLSTLAGEISDRNVRNPFERNEILSLAAAELADTLGVLEKDVEYYKELFQAFREVLPRHGMLITDMTTPAYLGLSEYPAYVPRSFFHPAGFGTLGFALPAAIGAKIADPERPVSILTGDGGFQFTMQELGVACEQELCLPLVIFNNDGYGEIRRTEEIRHPGKRIAVDLKNPNFLKLAEAYSIPSQRVFDGKELAQALTSAFKEKGPTLIEVVRK